MTSQEKMEKIAIALSKKKAKDLVCLKVSELTLMADYFVICSATSTTQVKALSDFVQEEMENIDIHTLKKESKQGLNWILLDYSDVLVHIFYQETRDFYALEKLWADAEEVDISEIVKE